MLRVVVIGLVVGAMCGCHYGVPAPAGWVGRQASSVPAFRGGESVDLVPGGGEHQTGVTGIDA